MKARKFIASEIVTYSQSNRKKRVEFNSLKEAVAHVNRERELHPRSNKFDSIILINGNYGKRFNAFDYDYLKKLFNNQFDEILTPKRREIEVKYIKEIGLKISDFK